MKTLKQTLLFVYLDPRYIFLLYFSSRNQPTAFNKMPVEQHTSLFCSCASASLVPLIGFILQPRIPSLPQYSLLLKPSFSLQISLLFCVCKAAWQAKRKPAEQYRLYFTSFGVIIKWCNYLNRSAVETITRQWIYYISHTNLLIEQIAQG